MGLASVLLSRLVGNPNDPTRDHPLRSLVLFLLLVVLVCFAIVDIAHNTHGIEFVIDHPGKFSPASVMSPGSRRGDQAVVFPAEVTKPSPDPAGALSHGL
jgi:hypothetical protein